MPPLLLVAFLALADEWNTGWRGNGTGLWPEARPPVIWSRIPKGAIEGMRARADRPGGAPTDDAIPVEKGLIRPWLVLGPFPVGDSVKQFDDDPVLGAPALDATAGGQTAGRVWKRADAPPDDHHVFGTAAMPWLDLVPAVGFQPNQLAYAHTYLFSPRGGPARIVVEHQSGLKAWINGRPVYNGPQRRVALGFYTAISRHELNYWNQPSPRFDVQLEPGWNRLLLKLSTSNRDDFKEMRFCLRIMDPPGVPYENTNILWMTELPGRSTSTPIQVGDRLFVMAEPDELLCLDKQSGRILWTAAINYYEALAPAARQAQPALVSRIDPLMANLKGEPDRGRRVDLRARIHQALLEIDESQFAIRANDHFEAHFGIVGNTMPTPVSDGRRVFAWCNTGVAACYDLDGRRQWIRRVPTRELSYGSSPALAEGVLAVFLDQLYGLDAATGELRWTQHRVQRNIGAVLPARFAGLAVFVTQRGEVIRPSDGRLLFRPPGFGSGDTGWSPPVILGETMYLPRYGVNELLVYDFQAVQSDEWQPQLQAQIGLPSEVSRGPNGQWIDRWTAGSPLVWQGLAYQTDIYHWLYVIDLAGRRMAYRRELDLHGLTHYNAVAVAASPTLVGKHLMVMDNQGTTLVLQPGREFQVVAQNRIATQLDRPWPIPAQETLCYAPPLPDGNRLYLRGERYLYCIGEKQ
jgi:hypothetical protein